MLSRILALFLVGLVGLVAACGTLRDAEAPGRALFDCTVNAFLPLAGTYDRAVEIVADVKAKRVDVAQVLDATQATHAEAVALDVSLRECIAQAKADLAELNDAGAPDAGE